MGWGGYSFRGWSCNWWIWGKIVGLDRLNCFGRWDGVILWEVWIVWIIGFWGCNLLNESEVDKD